MLAELEVEVLNGDKPGDRRRGFENEIVGGETYRSVARCCVGLF